MGTFSTELCLYKKGNIIKKHIDTIAVANIGYFHITWQFFVTAAPKSQLRILTESQVEMVNNRCSNPI